MNQEWCVLDENGFVENVILLGPDSITDKRNRLQKFFKKTTTRDLQVETCCRLHPGYERKRFQEPNKNGIFAWLGWKYNWEEDCWVANPPLSHKDPRTLPPEQLPG